MAYFIELQTIAGHPIMLNVDHIMYVEPLKDGCEITLCGMFIYSSESGGNLRSVSSQQETVSVKESYEAVKRKLNE